MERDDFNYRKLEVYQKAKIWVKDVYLLLKKLPESEKYVLMNQIQRAAFSVTSNIAEGMSRSSRKDEAHFLEIAYGSLMEVQSQFEIAETLGYISQNDIDELDPKTIQIAKMLSGLRSSLLKQTKD